MPVRTIAPLIPPYGEPWLALARTVIDPNIFPNHQVAVRFGHNTEVNPGTPTDLWVPGGAYPFPAAPVALEVVSTLATDTAAGAGARTVSVVGLDASHEPLQEVVTLNGLTPVALAQQFLRVNDFRVLTCGTDGENDGALVLRRAGGGSVQTRIRPGEGRDRTGIYTVRAGWTAFVYLLAASIRPEVDNSVSVTLWARTGPTDPWLWRVALTPSSSVPWSEVAPRVPGVFLERSDLRLSATQASHANSVVSGVIQMVLVKNA